MSTEAATPQPAAAAAKDATDGGVVVVVAAANDDDSGTHSPKSGGGSPTSRQHNKSVTRTDLMAVHAAECAASAQRNRTREQRNSSSLKVIAGLRGAALQDPAVNHSLIAAMEDDDRHMFTALPAHIKPARKSRTEFDREVALSRRDNYRNSEYRAAARQPHTDPRAIVDLNRPITPRFIPGRSPHHPAAPKGATSRYVGLSTGVVDGLSTDPLYTPGPDSRRAQIESLKQVQRSLNAPPLTSQQLQRKRGEPVVPASAHNNRVDADFVPRVASMLPDAHGSDACERRARLAGQTPRPFLC